MQNSKFFWIIAIFIFQIWLRMQNIIFLNFLDYKYFYFQNLIKNAK